MVKVNLVKEVATNFPLSTKDLQNIAQSVLPVALKHKQRKKREKYTFSVILVSLRKITELNSRYRQKNHPTDILSFSDGEVDEDDFFNLGDLILSPRYIRQEAQKYNNSLKKHYILLIIHGLFHLCGFDHVKDQDFLEMKRLEDQVARKVFRQLNVKF